MKKFVYIAILMIALTGCTTAEKSPAVVTEEPTETELVAADGAVVNYATSMDPDNFFTLSRETVDGSTIEYVFGFDSFGEQCAEGKPEVSAKLYMQMLKNGEPTAFHDGGNGPSVAVDCVANDRLYAIDPTPTANFLGFTEADTQLEKAYFQFVGKNSVDLVLDMARNTYAVTELPSNLNN